MSTPSGRRLLSRKAVATRLYDFLGDDFDFINLVYALPRWPQNRSHYGTRNDTLGIGLPVFDNTALYASAGRLSGISRYTLDTMFDLAETSALHELGHQWINFLSPAPLATGSPHWPPSTMARGIMGWSLAGGGGGTFPYAPAPLGGGMYRLLSAPPTRDFSRLDLYLMGLLPAASVGSFVVLTPASPAAVFPGAVVPGMEIGFDKGQTKPFALATSWLGSLVTAINCPMAP
jgi:hypothetical protein